MSAALLIGLSAPAFAIVNKPLIAPITSTPPAGTQVAVDADVFTYDTETEVGVATGTVKLVYGPYTLLASKVVYKQKTGEFDANGSIELREPNGNVMLADSLEMRNAFRDGFARHIKALLNNNGTITAPLVKRRHGHIFIYEKAHYTTCRDCRTRKGNPLWEVVSDQTTHDTESHNFYHVHPRLKIDGHTILALPYWEMPDPSVTRRSGFLSPDIRAEKPFGYGVVTPYFWALSPSYDLTFQPLWTTKQGPVADVEWRHALENGGYNIRARGVHQFTPLAAPDSFEWRGSLDSYGNFRADEHWSYGWGGTFVSDREFLRSYGYDGRVYSANNAYVTALWDQTYINAQMLNFQSMWSGLPGENLPNAMPFISGETIDRNLSIGGQLDLQWNAYSLHRGATQTPFTTVNHGTDQTRATVQANWHEQLFSDAGTVVTPFATLRSDLLMSNNVPDSAAPGGFHETETVSRVLPKFGVDMRWPFIASTSFGQSIISPVVQIIASANEGATNAFGNEDAITLNYDHTSLFLADRFTGLDRYEGGTRADVGVTYSLIRDNGGFIRASAGQSIHLAGQNSFVDGSGLADNDSDLVGAVVFQPWTNFSLSYEARVKENLSHFNRQEAVASLSFDRFSAYASYLDFAAEPAYGRTESDRWISGDARIGLSDGWSVFGGLSYDFMRNVLTRRSLGVEFDCECMNFKLAYSGSEDLTSHVIDHKVLLSVEFATLGKTSASVGF